MTVDPLVLVVADDENDDWLKKIEGGRWRRHELEIHKELEDREKKRKDKEDAKSND